MGVTDVVTLQRGDEMRPFLPEACEELELCWRHVPLSGRRLERREDRESLTRIPAIVGLLEAGRHVVVHCAAGMHRTGICMYLVLRHVGYDEEEAMALIEQSRPVTATELRKKTRKNGILREKAEAIFQQQKSV